jgi:hypothetical protein
MKRRVERELLDDLPARDPRATRSRHEIYRLNRTMGHARIMARALAAALRGRESQSIVDLGAGDGRFLLMVANELHGRWPLVEATLVDRLDAFDPGAIAGLGKAGWRPRMLTLEALEWLAAHREPVGAIVANLFLHQFAAQDLSELLRLSSGVSEAFIAVEPRRGGVGLLLSRMLWLTGFGEVTRHDGPISVRAGFKGTEISALWPDLRDWSLTERRAGLFSHLFIAQKKR